MKKSDIVSISGMRSRIDSFLDVCGYNQRKISHFSADLCNLSKLTLLSVRARDQDSATF